MIIWGGGEGVDSTMLYKYNPLTNTWTSISSIGAPSSRASHSAVWTGTEMIIWGGGEGVDSTMLYKYNPLTNTWTSISTINAPSGRSNHSAIWSGTEMIVWGGYTKQLSDSNKISIYNPLNNNWSNLVGINSPLIKYNHSACWNGAEMIVVGGNFVGNGISDKYSQTYFYNLGSNQWVEIPINTNTPTWRAGHSAIFDGNEMIIWGGNNDIGKTMKLISPTYSGSVSTYLHIYKKN
jgi:N-acetylneuraminic acid mutarotase